MELGRGASALTPTQREASYAMRYGWVKYFEPKGIALLIKKLAFLSQWPGEPEATRWRQGLH